MDPIERSRAFARRGVFRLAGGLLLAMPISRSRAAESTIGIDNFSFAPALLSVAVGTVVTWTNHDDIPHSVVCPALKFRSHVLDTDQTFTFQFDQNGEFDYFCGLHSHMKGKVVVAA